MDVERVRMTIRWRWSTLRPHLGSNQHINSPWRKHLKVQAICLESDVLASSFGLGSGNGPCIKIIHLTSLTTTKFPRCWRRRRIKKSTGSSPST
jgi:hypothetical protein